MNIKAIIFDWGGTLVDDHMTEELPESEQVLDYCRGKGYRMAVASLTKYLERRKAQFLTTPLNKFFEAMLGAEINKGEESDINLDKKNKMFDQIVQHFGLPRNEILIVDDRAFRGVKYGNKNGHPTVWIQKGKYANELPNAETGQPTYTIHDLKELKDIL